MTATANSLISKYQYGLKESVISVVSKDSEFTFIHDFLVRPLPYKGPDSTSEKEEQEDQFQYTNPKTSFYICKQYHPSLELEQMPRYLMKRLAYRTTNQTDQWGRLIYNNSQTKNIDQVATEYQCLTLLKDSHRVISLKGFIHENVELKSDKKFFYQSLKLPDKRSKGIRNICFILEEMNEGSLKYQIEKISDNKQPFSEEKIIEYSCQFAQGLNQLRNRGIIHRDLRPENVLIHNGQLKFADFDSAFIKGYSDYRNIKNGVDMKETTPLQIMLLIAQSEEKLKQIDSDELFERQQKADIYYLGINIYSMVFSQMYESFNGGQVLRNLIHIKKRSGFCPKLLDLMSACLEKDPHVRINMDQVIKILSEIQQEFYLKSPTYKKTYLGAQPMNLLSFSSNQVQSKAEAAGEAEFVEESNNRKEMDQNFQDAMKVATLQRTTAVTEKLFKNNNVWGQTSKSKLFKINQVQLVNRIETFLERLQIKAYYYELAYRVLFEVNLAEVKSTLHFENLRNHLDLFSNQLVVILTFIYDTILKCTFTQDPLFADSNPTYELRRVFENVRTLHSRWQFFSGRLRLQNEANRRKKQLNAKLQQAKTRAPPEGLPQLEQLEETLKVALNGINIVDSLQNMLEHLRAKQYESAIQRMSFFVEERLMNQYLDKTENIVKTEMVQTIVSLILAYEKIKTEPWGFRCNLKNAIFMLMILEAQNTKTVGKNDMVLIKTELTTMIKLKLGWKSEELEAFFNNYTTVHSEEVMQGLIQLESQAVILSEKTNEAAQLEDFCIQINAPQKEELPNRPILSNIENTPKFREETEEGEKSTVRHSIEAATNMFNQEKKEDAKGSMIQVEVLEESNVRDTYDCGLIVSKLSVSEKLNEKKQSAPRNKYMTVESYD